MRNHNSYVFFRDLVGEPTPEKKKLVKIQYSLKCRLIYIILNKVNLKDNFDN